MPVELKGTSAITMSDADRAEFFAAVEPSLHINTQEQFFQWTQNELQRVFPHEKLVCGIGRLSKKGAHIRHVMGHNFPDEYVQTLQRPGGLTSSPILVKWMAEQQPILFEPGTTEIDTTGYDEWLNNFQRFGLVNLAAHGMSDVDSHTGSYFSFSTMPGPLTQRHAYLLKMLIPHLHVALVRVVSNPRFLKTQSTKQSVKLTQREKEVLQWLATGKSNWEIAQVIGLSESTVKNHVHRVLGRLKVGSRAQAVAKAINTKLISTRL